MPLQNQGVRMMMIIKMIMIRTFLFIYIYIFTFQGMRRRLKSLPVLVQDANGARASAPQVMTIHHHDDNYHHGHQDDFVILIFSKMTLGPDALKTFVAERSRV